MSTGSSAKDADTLEFPHCAARIWTLPNGLELIVKEDRAAPVVSLQAWCRAGSIHEGNRLGAGMSHFLEHMLFKGTKKRNGIEIAQTVQSFGGYINAYTSFDRTVYWIDTPTSGAEGCLDILCDVISSSQIPEDEFEKESEVIRREISMGEDNPDSVLGKMLFRNAYTSHPCRHPVIGYLDLFNQLTREDLYQYYQEKYSADNFFIVICGDVDPEKIYEQVLRLTGDWERSPGGPPVLPAEPKQFGIRSEESEFPTDLARARYSWQIPNAMHPDAPPLDLLAAILGSGRSSRLYQSIREQQQLAHRVSAYSYSPSFDGIFSVVFDTEPEKYTAAEKAIFSELEKIKTGGVTQSELNRTARQTLSAQFGTLTSVNGQASDIGSNWILTRNLDFTRDYVNAVQQTNCEDIVRVANKYLDLDTYTKVSLIPVGKKKDSATSGAPLPSRSEDIRKVELGNGLTVLLLSDKRVPFVQASGVFRGGLLSETSEKSGVTRLMSRLLTKDTTKRSARDLAEMIESVGGGMSNSFGNNSIGMAVGAMRPDLDLVVDLLGETLLDSAFHDEVLEKEKAFQITGIKAERDRPFTIALKRLRREIFGGHPYGLEASGTPESVARLQREDLIAHHQRLIKGGNGVVGVFGDLDLDHAEDLVRERFTSQLQSGEREFTSPCEISMPEKYGQVVEIKHEKEQAILLIAYRTVDLLHTDNPALEMIDEACSDMASRMFIRIREDLGLAYSVGATRMIGLQSGFLAFYAATSPEKIDLVQSEMLDEIKKITDEGLDPAEFDRAKASWLGRETIQLQSAKELAGIATIDELIGIGWDHYRKAPDIIRSLTSQKVHEAAHKYLREDNQIIVRLTT